MLQLSSERLRVDIATPGTIYRGCRFDWSGFITQVTLDGRHTFCTPESLVPGEGTGGIGLCNEFSPFAPPGFDEAKPGEWFSKLGVGLLQRPDTEPHRFIREYTVEPFPLSGRHDDRSAAFRFEPVLCGGYAVRLTKTVRVYGERLSVAYELMNVGTRRICTREYNHNFLAPAGTGAGPDLELRLSPGLQLVRFGGGLEQTGALVRWAGIPAKSYMAVSRERLRHRTAGPVWELRHRVAGIGVSESVDMPVEQFGVWFAPHAVSPEVFVEIDIRPGQSAAWTREWRFFEC